MYLRKWIVSVLSGLVSLDSRKISAVYIINDLEKQVLSIYINNDLIETFIAGPLCEKKKK